VTDEENLALLERALEMARDAREITQGELTQLLDWVEVLLDTRRWIDEPEELYGDPDDG
jgi:hypothetical protein